MSTKPFDRTARDALHRTPVRVVTHEPQFRTVKNRVTGEDEQQVRPQYQNRAARRARAKARGTRMLPGVFVPYVKPTPATHDLAA